MNVVQEIFKINLRELEAGIASDSSASWHAKYKNTAYIFVGNLDYTLTEGDLLCVFSQCGEIVDLNLCRDKETGKPMGFAFIAYENQKSTLLAVDNFNGAKLMGRTIRVDHTENYKMPKAKKKDGVDSDDENGNDSEEEYRARRKSIWDYELYGDPSANQRDAALSYASEVGVVDGAAAASASADIDSNDPEVKRVAKIKQILEAKKAHWALASRAEKVAFVFFSLVLS